MILPYVLMDISFIVISRSGFNKIKWQNKKKIKITE